MTVLNEWPGTDARLSLAPDYEPERSEVDWGLSEREQNSELNNELDFEIINEE